MFLVGMVLPSGVKSTKKFRTKEMAKTVSKYITQPPKLALVLGWSRVAITA
jgi:hypothetical protein